jgi:hypothetical protein
MKNATTIISLATSIVGVAVAIIMDREVLFRTIKNK